MNLQQKIHYDSSYDIKNNINKNILIINNSSFPKEINKNFVIKFIIL